MIDRRGKFISIHGIDGTGKTTTAEHVASHLQAAGVPAINYDTYKEGVSNPFSKKKKETDERGTIEDRLAAHLESMMFHAQQVESFLQQGYHVVKSRYLDDIQAHFLHLGVSPQNVRKLVDTFPMVQPDLKVLLTLEEEDRQKRIAERGRVDEKDSDKKVPGSRAQYFEDFLLETIKKSPTESVLHVDSGKLDVSKITQKIVDRLVARV